MESAESIKRKIEHLMTDLETNLFDPDNRVKRMPYQPFPLKSNGSYFLSITPSSPDTILSTSNHETPEVVYQVTGQLKQSIEKERLLTKHVDELKISATRDSALIAQLKDEISRLKKYEESIQDQNKRTTQDQEKQAQHSGAIQTLPHTIDQGKVLQESLDKKDREIIELHNEIDQLKNLKEQAQEHLSPEKIDVYELTRTTSNFLDKAVKDQERQITEMSGKNARLLHEKKMFQKELREIKDQHIEDEKEIRLQSKRLNEIQEKYLFMEEQLHAKDEEISNLYLHIQEYERKNQALEVSSSAPPQVSDLSQGEAVSSQFSGASEESVSLVNRFIGWLKKPVIEIQKEEEED